MPFRGKMPKVYYDGKRNFTSMKHANHFTFIIALYIKRITRFKRIKSDILTY